MGHRYDRDINQAQILSLRQSYQKDYASTTYLKFRLRLLQPLQYLPYDLPLRHANRPPLKQTARRLRQRLSTPLAHTSLLPSTLLQPPLRTRPLPPSRLQHRSTW